MKKWGFLFILLFQVCHIFFMKVYSTAEAKARAEQVDRSLPKGIKFYRYGDRTTQIIRFLIENDMDVAKTVVAIKQTALFRKYWHADEIKISDVKNAFAEWECYPTGVTKNGKMVWYMNCHQTTAPKIEDFMLVSIYMIDDIQKRLYEACKERGIQEAYKDYCIWISDTAGVSLSALSGEIQKGCTEVFIRHFPAFMSASDIEINDDPNYVPARGWDDTIVYNLNTPFLLRSIWKLCSFFLPSRWAYMVQLLGSSQLPASIDKALIPQEYGGTYEGSFETWMEECARMNECSLDDPPRTLVDQRVLDQFGQNNGMIASSIPETELRGWMWKRTNVGHRWHHYYFVLLKEGLLYYFVRTDDMNAQNGFMLDNCRIVVCDQKDDLKREGVNSIILANNVLKFTQPPRLEGTQLEETRGEEQPGENHRYWFILRTPSRDYVFACNTLSQRSQWMYFLQKGIRNADLRALRVLDLNNSFGVFSTKTD